MVAGSRIDGGSQIISVRVRRTIQSIKEIVGNHSDADIYAMLKETNMDPNETAQKLLNQDPFHEVKRKRDKKKEIAGYSGFSGTRQRVDHNVQWAKSQTSWDRNVRRGGYSRNPGPGVSREFRIVRDNRVKQNANKDIKPETAQHLASGKEQVKSNVPEKSSTGTLADQKLSAASNSNFPLLSQIVNENHVKDVGSTGSRRLPEETQATTSVSNLQAQREARGSSQTHSSSTSTHSVIGVYSSSSDPVHVPSPAKRSAGSVGAIRREVGVVGVRRQTSGQPALNASVSDGTFSVPLLGRDGSASSESFGQSAASPKNNQLNQAAGSEHIMSGMPISRPISGSQYNSKTHQQPVGHLKAMQPNMEWKPKSSQKSTVISPTVSATASASTSSRVDADSSRRSNQMDDTDLSEKISQVNILEHQHVIIPQHLRVPESERTRLAFGSFGAGFDSTKGFTSNFEAFESAERSIAEPSVSTSASVPVSSSGDTSSADQGDLVECQARTSRSDSPALSAVSEQPSPGKNESLSPHNIESYADIGLVQSHSPPYTSPQAQQLQASTGLPSFSAYDPQSSYDVPFFRTVMEDNVRGQGLALSSEAPSSHAANSSPPSTVALAQSQQQVQQQQQAVAQMYPQVHISHYPNFVPYRHVFSPVYVPPMAMPNYSSNPAYPHPSTGNSYLLMPGGNSHLTAGGMKYAASQYKPVPAGSPTGYGNYTNPAGFTISAPGSVGGPTGLEDATRIKYKDNNLYVPNPQAEADIWIQTPRELPNIQSAPYYNLSGQAPHAAAAAFMPAAHTGHASFNAAAQSSHVQYPGLYHPSPQPASIAGNPHHLVHQPGLGSGIGGVGVAAAPAPQVGNFQQPQLSHLNWPANF